MKKTILSLALTAVTVLSAMSLHSCGLVDFDHSENGHLDGYWHLVSVDSLGNGTTTDLSQQRYYWAVQGTLLQLYSPDWQSGQRFVSQFRYQNATFTVLEIHVDRRYEGDPVVDDINRVRPFGLNNITETFQVDDLSGRSLTLSTADLRLRFKKM